jgi:hypothetical protein
MAIVMKSVWCHLIIFCTSLKIPSQEKIDFLVMTYFFQCVPKPPQDLDAAGKAPEGLFFMGNPATLDAAQREIIELAIPKFGRI